jgi:5-formyltetrahydrofolate cyclo-ligase
MDTGTDGNRKQRIRNEMKKTLAAISGAECAEKSGKIRAAISSSPLWEKVSVLAAFLPLPGEPDMRPLLEEALAQGKKVCLPRMDGNDIIFHFVRGFEKTLVTHAWGISEPAGDLPRACPPDFSGGGAMVLVPGLAFDRQGHRLGRGRGFYDRFLRDLSARGIHPLALGTAFSCQILDAVPADENDFPLSGLVSEEHGLLLF